MTDAPTPNTPNSPHLSNAADSSGRKRTTMSFTPTAHNPSTTKDARTHPYLAVADDATYIRLLEAAFAEADNTGRLAKDMFTPALCRTNTMKLWRQVLLNKQFPHLKHIQLRWCALESAGIKILAEGLASSCKHIETLDLMGNEIGVSGSMAIAQLMAPGVDLNYFEVAHTNQVLQRLRANKNTAGPPAAAQMAIGCIRTLVLSYNCICDGGCSYLGKAMCLNTTLATLEIENCEIGDNGCKYLRRGIERNACLRYVNLAANRFGDLGAREIQSFLIRNQHLTKLDVSRNRLGPQRTMEIAKGLTVNKSLKVLRMNINRIGARGAQLLGKMLIHNRNLEELEISYNEIFNDGIQVLSQGLLQNRGLRRIVLWYNGLEDSAAKQLAKALHSRTKHPHFRNAIVKAIADVQPDLNEVSQHIVDYVPIYMYFELDLSHNSRISKTGIDSLLEVINSHSVCVQGMEAYLAQHRADRDKYASQQTALY